MSDIPQANYFFDEVGHFVVENYNWAKPFSNFFPGIAGKWGIPLWAYYVNRGQGVCSLGVRDKDNAILEFHSFNKACQTVGQQGFRTFIRIDGTLPYEAFKKRADLAIRQQMSITAHEITLRETNSNWGLEISVTYFPLVNMPLAGLVRLVTLTNTGPQPKKIELLDGVARLLPYGVNFEQTKVTARHIEAMMGVFEVEGVPLFKLKQTPADIERVGEIKGGNFYLSTLDSGESLNHQTIVDPGLVFGDTETHDYPWGFRTSSVGDLLAAHQIRENRTPCSFTALQQYLGPGGSMTLKAVIGFSPKEALIQNLKASLQKPDFVAKKRAENKEIVDKIKNATFTASSEALFDQYCQQTFLDNVLRGGMPLTFDSQHGKRVFYIFWRQNGDLERDYHWFVLEPTYLSQGTSHYRNINQNRRMDTWFFPEIEDSNIRTLLSLIQTDGYNPLEIKGQTYIIENSSLIHAWLHERIPVPEARSELMSLIQSPFTPGEFVMALEGKGVKLEDSGEAFLSELLPLCRENEIGGLHDGFWIDHWHYNLDLIDSFLAIYPDRLRALLLDESAYTFYDNPDVVRPRAEKLVLVEGAVRQYKAVRRDPEKARRIRSRPEGTFRVCTKGGEGEVYSTHLVAKLLCIIANKIATLDPAGLGVEMEAGKPGWCDSLNGLPGLLSSSLCESLELIRLCRWLEEKISVSEFSPVETATIFEELHEFILGLWDVILKRLASRSEDRAFIYWEESHYLKEIYWQDTRFGVTGKEREMRLRTIRRFLRNCLDLLEGNLFQESSDQVINPRTGVPYTYFINQVLDYRALSEKESNTQCSSSPVIPTQFQQRPVAHFLEGPVHYLRVRRDAAQAVYEAVRRSNLYDRKLGMYRCCESLEQEPLEIGRIKAYARGWLENESIYTHMEYKWMLEVLRSGLYDAFYQDFKEFLPPFQDAHKYGRSLLEGSSFICSNVYPDPQLRGQAFQPRLSGVTSELLHIWTIMVAGEEPFFLGDDHRLYLRLQPRLPNWLFTRDSSSHRYWDPQGGWQNLSLAPNCFAFKFLNKVLVIYHNSSQKHTYGVNGARPSEYKLLDRNGKQLSIETDTIFSPYAESIRSGEVRRIDVILS